MVAKIESGKSLIGALNYNESKLERGRAKLLMASGYLKDKGHLKFNDKLFRLTDLAARNERTKTNTVHISLNFANGEQLSDEKLNTIATDYMKGIGFANQPFLVYRHEDAGHPHIHIVTTNIQSNGERISLHYLGQNQSEKTRKAIEVEHGLVKADEQTSQKPEVASKLSPAVYGKAETKRVITNILTSVLRSYKFTTLTELNSVLQGFNITADRGEKDSAMYKRSGLMYSICDGSGKKVGVPIKASSIYGRPTLNKLEEKFKLNLTLRKPAKDGLVTILDSVLAKPLTPVDLIVALSKLDIKAVYSKNNDGLIYGVTFIDERSKAVFKGSDLGKRFSANALNEFFLKPYPETKTEREKHNDIQRPVQHQKETDGTQDVMDILFQQEKEGAADINQYKKKKKKKGLRL